MASAFVAASRRSAVNLRRYIQPSQHVWCQVNNPNKDSDTTHTVQIGLTLNGIDRLGDVTAIDLLSQQQQQSDKQQNARHDVVQAGQNLLAISWEGYKQSDADELYHTVWESMYGCHTVQSPISGTLLSVYEQDPNQVEVDEETVLAVVGCSDQQLNAAMKTWVSPDEYGKIMVQKQDLGQFADCNK